MFSIEPKLIPEATRRQRKHLLKTMPITAIMVKMNNVQFHAYPRLIHEQHVRVDQPLGVRAAGRRDAERGHFYLGHPATAGRVVVRGLPGVLEGPAEGPRGHAGDGVSVEPERRFARNRGDDAAREDLELGDRAARLLPLHRREDARRVLADGGGQRLPLRDEKRTRAQDRHAHA